MLNNLCDTAHSVRFSQCTRVGLLEGGAFCQARHFWTVFVADIPSRVEIAARVLSNSGRRAKVFYALRKVFWIEQGVGNNSKKKVAVVCLKTLY